MIVDFAWGTTPKLRVAAIAWKGPWNEGRIRNRFEAVARWAKERRVRTGRWIFREPSDRSWEVAIEVKGPARGSGGVRVKTLPPATVARVVFDPEKVSPRVIYHGLSDWLRWRRKEKEIRRVLHSREVYQGNPWSDARAWARTEVQFVVQK
jgi:hypothetical protein